MSTPTSVVAAGALGAPGTCRSPADGDEDNFTEEDSLCLEKEIFVNGYFLSSDHPVVVECVETI